MRGGGGLSKKKAEKHISGSAGGRKQPLAMETAGKKKETNGIIGAG